MRRAGWAAKPNSAARCEVHQQRLGRAATLEQVGGGAVGEAHRPFVVDNHHRVGEAVEDRLELVAVGGEHAEALLQRGAHRVEGASEFADLIAGADPQRRVEGARGHFVGGLGEPRDAVGDRDRDQEAGEHADQHGNDQRLLVVAEEIDGKGGDQRDGGKRPRQPQPHAYPSHEELLTQNESEPHGRISRCGLWSSSQPGTRRTRLRA